MFFNVVMKKKCKTKSQRTGLRYNNKIIDYMIDNGLNK